VAAAVMFTVCNGPFVRVWAEPNLAWPAINDVLLGLWLVLTTSMRVQTGLAGQTKRFAFLRFIYFLEGSAFVLIALLLQGRGGVTGMLLASIGCTFAFSFPYGLHRTREYFGLRWSQLLEWHHAALAMCVWTIPMAAIVWWLSREMALPVRLFVNTGVVGVWTLWGLLRYGLNQPLKFEVLARAPNWVRPVLLRAGLRWTEK